MMNVSSHSADNRLRNEVNRIKAEKQNAYFRILFFPLMILFWELFTASVTFGKASIGALLSPLGIGIGLYFIAKSFTKKKNARGAASQTSFSAIGIILILAGLICAVGKVSVGHFILLILSSSLSAFIATRIRMDSTPCRILTIAVLAETGTALIIGDMAFAVLLRVFLISLSSGLLLTFFLSLPKRNGAIKIIASLLVLILAVIFATEVVVYSAFSQYFGLDGAGGAGHLEDFQTQAVTAITDSIIPILILLLPLPLLLTGFKRAMAGRHETSYGRLKMLTGAVVPFLAVSLIIGSDKQDNGLLATYHHAEMTPIAQEFGLLTSVRMELERKIFGEKELTLDVDPDIDNPFDTIGTQGNTDAADTTGDGSDTTSEPQRPIPTGDNVMEIDFDKLIAESPNDTITAMHKYFASQTPTAKNEYTGIFEGKNLIFMTLEGFSGKIIDPELTPTLYRMATEGFVFNNFYCSMWGGSTATGEYANMTGLFYNKASCLSKMKDMTIPFAFGNQFKKLGYSTPAYHANSYDYYSRHISHPAMGYSYIGRGTGVENLVDRNGDKMVKCWPFSDEELADVTIDQYINNQPFCAYYMTISGHGYYSWGGNTMSSRNRSRVKNLPYSDDVKAYIACNLEVEDMVTKLCSYLDEAGILEDTVFVMSCDHYPYMMSDAALAELYRLPEEKILENYDLYRNTLILWSASMKKPVVVDVPCSAIDIVPTVSNLFGLEYDSRLLPGTDVLSGTDPLVILNCVSGPSWGWINRYGSYSTTRGFVAAPGYEDQVTGVKTYVSQINKIVSNKRNYTFKILTENYYKYIFGNG